MERLTYHQFAMMSPEEIGKLNKKQMVDLLKDARKKLSTRLNQFNKQGRYFYSPAQDKIEDHYENNPQVPLEKMTRNKAMAEVFLIQDFFRAKTGTVKGAREVMREQDARIFNVNEDTGRPLHKLTKEQRTAFWKVYYEFQNQYKTAMAMFKSGNIQQYLGERVLSEKGRKFDLNEDMTILHEMWEDLLARKQSESGHNENRNIYTGRGNNR